MGNAHRARAGLRAALGAGRRLTGVFVKLPSTDVVEMAAAAGFDLVVVDLEHAALAEADALALVGYADARGLPVVVRVPQVDPALVNRLLEAGAAGIQLSMLSSVAQRTALQAAVTYGPGGARSISLSHRSAGYGRDGLSAYLDAERADPPVLVGQIEGPTTDSLDDVVAGLDVAFVGTTDLTVALGLDPADRASVSREVAAVAEAAARAGVVFGGWAPGPEAIDGLGLAGAGYVVLGSDMQFLATALQAAAAPPSEVS
jgi:2-keto-3-deoxy-L-rhamnonate aldolase RhmA